MPKSIVLKIACVLMGCAILSILLGAGCGQRKVTHPRSSSGSGPIGQINQNSSEGWMPAVWQEYLKHGPTGRHLPDFSYAGYAMGRRPIPDRQGPVFDVTHPKFGALADDDLDDTAAIQAAIESAGEAGGGIVFLPKGRYIVHGTAKAPFLRIRSNHVILRGQGDSASGTILHLKTAALEGPIRRLGSVPAEQDARHYAAIAIIGAQDRQELASYAQDLPRGKRVAKVSDSSRLVVGQTVVIEFSDPRIDPLHPRSTCTDIGLQLTCPFRFVGGQTDTFGVAAMKHTWLVKIDEIIDRHTIRLAKPARFNQFKRYSPRLFSFGGVRGAGIENLRIESSWPGGYRHHKPFLGADGTVVRSAKEQDYLWCGVWISNAADGWIRNVTFKDLTQGIIVSHATDMTIRDVRFKGLDGHAGITIGRSNDILVTRADFFARMVHPVTLTMMASGNVVTDCTVHYDGRDGYSATDAVIDFHGLFPHENLFDNLKGFYICPGGDLSVLPHGGVRNVFWNIQAPRQMSCYTCSEDNEFFRTYDYASTSSGTPATMFEHLPQAFYIGIQRREGGIITVAGSNQDQRNQWMTVEGLNRPNIAIPSLYKAQQKPEGSRSSVAKGLQ